MPQKKKGFSIQGFDVSHYKQTESYVQAIDALYNQAVMEYSKIAGKVNLNPDKLFSFADYPGTRGLAQTIVNQLAAKMQAVIISGSREQWLYACNKNDEFLASIMNTSKVPKKILEKYQDRNLDALDTFQKRKVNGMDLSKRVWNYADQMKSQMELGIDVALGEGKSAQDLSKALRKHLLEPDKLFHKVRDKHGILKLSKAAAAYHPGQGVYRSSYKNAMRLTRSEINMAYRESDQLRWQQLDFIVGYEIRLSNNHTTLINGVPTPFEDICDHLAGKYPKAFKFKGWHPQCRCWVYPIMMDDEEFNTDELNELRAALKGTEYKKYPSKNQVNDVPDNFKQWIQDNAERTLNWSSQPYWIRDNFKGGTIQGGLSLVKPTIAPPAPAKPVKPAKTEEQKQAIQAKWNKHQLTKKYQAELDGIEALYGTTPSIKKLYNKINDEIAKGTDQKTVDAMVEKINHKTKVKDAWDKQKPIKKAKAVFEKMVKTATNMMLKAEGSGFTGPELDAVKAAIADPNMTTFKLKKVHTKLANAYKAAASTPKDPFSKAALLKKYTQEEVDGLFAAYDKFYAAKITGKDIGTQMNKLEFEVDWLSKNGKYSTSGELKKMLERDLKNLKKSFEVSMIKNEAQTLVNSNNSTNSPLIKKSVQELQKLISDKNVDASTLKAAIRAVEEAVDDYVSNNIRTISPEDHKYFEDETDDFSITKFYTEAEKQKVKELRKKVDDVVKKYKGNLRHIDNVVREAQTELAEYMYKLQFKYVTQQKPIEHIGIKLNKNDEFEFPYVTEAEARAAFERYVAASASGKGYYSNNVGGEFWTSDCRAYTKRVKAAGVDITSEATLPTRYFSGSGFINNYLKKTDFHGVKSDKAMQDKLHDYVTGLSYAVNKLPRHNGVTYRGVVDSSGTIIAEILACKNSGQPFVHKLGMSTSITPKVADGFGRDITFKIYGKSGIYAREFSAYSSEVEVLYRAGSRFEVLEVYKETTGNGIAINGSWTVVLKEILK